MTDNTINPRKFYTARAEYFACREDVETMLRQGYSIRLIYERMEEEQRITCSYSAFCDYVRGNGTRKHSRRKKPLPQGRNRTLTERSGPIIVQAKSEGFPDPRTMRIEDAI